MRSKVRSPPIKARMITVVIAGRDSGRMIFQNRWTAVAPSTEDASKYSRGIETIPAMKITVASPTPFQTSTSATDSRANLGSTSQAGPLMPMRARDLLMTPADGSMRTWKVRPTPMVLTRTGKKTTERRYPRPMIGEVSSSANSIPKTTLSTKVTTA
jgi:hypothetical protein